jgi:hypothetical protein
VRRVIRRQREEDNARANQPELRLQLSDINGVPGDQVVHTFRAGTTYCVEILQWACGSPIGWGTCYQGPSRMAYTLLPSAIEQNASFFKIGNNFYNVC